MKIGTPKQLRELNECTSCHGYTKTGYELRDNNVSRFVCDECYHEYANDYPICKNMLEINHNVLEKIVPNEKKPIFQAGYFLGTREQTSGIEKLTVTEHLSCLPLDKGSATFFSPDDVMKIRKITKEKGYTVIALYRTNPSGSPVFNALDTKTISDMINVMPYVIVGGSSEIQIAVRDKNYPAYEYGVTII